MFSFDFFYMVNIIEHEEQIIYNYVGIYRQLLLLDECYKYIAI